MYNNPSCYVQSSSTVTVPPTLATSIPTTTAYINSDYFTYIRHYFNDYAVMSAYYGGAGISTFPSQSSAYRSYLLPNDKLSLSRPSRTVPSRVIPAKTYKTLYTRRDRGQTAEPYFFDPRRYRSGSGPWKDTRNWPMYWKKRKFTQPIQTYQESEFGGNPIDRIPHNYYGYYTTPSDMQHTVMRRVRPYYAPSYITYPPSIMNPNRSSKVVDEKYPLIMRVIIKIIELMLGASTTAFVLAPIRDLSFFEFVKITQTEWQGIVVGVGVTFSVLCIILLTTASLAQRSSLWRRFDGMISLGGTICYFLAGGIEAYYAACYPPRGAIIGLVCYRFEWIFASALIFVNVIVYIVDCVLSFRIGTKML